MSTEESKDMPDKDVKITLYENGYVVEEDDNLKPYDDEEGKAFMSELNKGYIPEPLRKKYPGKKMGVALEDKRGSKFIPPPPPKYVAFSGGGASLGGTAGVGGTVNKDAADGKPAVDESKPKTNLQIRFHNGERATLTLNMTHTVGDIHAYVMSAAPVEGEYSLVTGFPPKPLSDPGATLESIGLKNAAIIQKIV